ncbi:opsin transporter [Aureococcus anophagefferens]|uniref:Opsin transporter n=1 Tax=Aureococcus anophagefferens TaxID=44056 RepID=A0ABR1FTL2_AURAN
MCAVPPRRAADDAAPGAFPTENQEFSQLITGIVEVLDSNAQRIENAKLKAIGMRNRVLSERENRDQHRRALQAMIAEKTAELERYQTQHQSLSQVEAEQRALVDKLGNSEV